MDKNFLISLSIECFTALLMLVLFFFLYKKNKTSFQSSRVSPGAGKNYWSIPGWNWKRDFEFLTELINRYTEREFDLILLEVNNKYGINKDAVIKDSLCNEHAAEVSYRIWHILGDDYKSLLTHYLGSKETCMEYISSEVHFKMLKLSTSKNRSTVNKKFRINVSQPEKPVINKTTNSTNVSVNRNDI